MADRTRISYCDATVNPVRGCTPISEGCANCFAKGVAPRFCGHLVDEHGNWTGDVELHPEQLELPLRWSRKPRIILWETMGDIFHEAVPSEFIAACFGVMAATQQHTHLVLTKRIERVAEWLAWMDAEAERCSRHVPGHRHVTRCFTAATTYIDTPAGFGEAIGPERWPLPNVVIGTTVENQPRANERLSVLAQTAAMGWRTWVSVEPQLGSVFLGVQRYREKSCGCLSGCLDCDFSSPTSHHFPFEFVAVGAETGPGARPCKTEWVRDVVGQCRRAGVKVHVKQLTGHRDMSTWPEDLRVRDMP